MIGITPLSACMQYLTFSSLQYGCTLTPKLRLLQTHAVVQVWLLQQALSARLSLCAIHQPVNTSTQQLPFGVFLFYGISYLNNLYFVMSFLLIETLVISPASQRGVLNRNAETCIQNGHHFQKHDNSESQTIYTTIFNPSIVPNMLPANTFIFTRIFTDNLIRLLFK